MRREYVKAILKQDIGWFDEHPAGQLPTAVTSNMAKVSVFIFYFFNHSCLYYLCMISKAIYSVYPPPQ